MAEVAAHEGVEPVELDPPLFEAIPPDALNDVVRRWAETPGEAGSLEFSYAGYRVEVTATGEVSVADAGPRPQAPTSVDRPEY